MKHHEASYGHHYLNGHSCNYFFKGSVGLFEVWLYEVLIDSQCATYSRLWLAGPKFGEADRGSNAK